MYGGCEGQPMGQPTMAQVMLRSSPPTTLPMDTAYGLCLNCQRG